MTAISSENITQCALAAMMYGWTASCWRVLTAEVDRLISMMLLVWPVESAVVGGPVASISDVPGTSCIHGLIVFAEAAVVIASAPLLLVAITDSLPLPSGNVVTPVMPAICVPS